VTSAERHLHSGLVVIATSPNNSSLCFSSPSIRSIREPPFGFKPLRGLYAENTQDEIPGRPSPEKRGCGKLRPPVRQPPIMEPARALTGVTSVPPMLPQHGGRQLDGKTSDDESSEPRAASGRQAISP
jgi:hypothetical protein